MVGADIEGATFGDFDVHIHAAPFAVWLKHILVLLPLLEVAAFLTEVDGEDVRVEVVFVAVITRLHVLLEVRFCKHHKVFDAVFVQVAHCFFVFPTFRYNLLCRFALLLQGLCVHAEGTRTQDEGHDGCFHLYYSFT